MRTIAVKRIIQPNNNFNLYRGCTHGCIYCDSRSDCYQVGDFENVAIKQNAVALVAKELASKRHKTVLTTGSMSDPYVQIEKELEITKQVLQLIEKYRFGVSVLTKSDLLLRDIDIYERINKNHKAIVQMTVTTTDDRLARIIEPRVSPPSRRFAVLREFSARGITTGIWMTPILPFIEDTEANILAIVENARAAGVAFIIAFGIGTTMRAGSREHYYDHLDRLFPGVKQRYIDTYGDKYICNSPDSKRLLEVFRTACDRLGIIHDQQTIRDLFKMRAPEQMTLF